MADYGDADRERIALAIPRASSRVTGQPSRRPPPTEAGLALLVDIALGGGLGSSAGGLLAAHSAGALVGGLAGLVAGFAATYLRYRER